MTELAKRIKELRKQNKLYQSELADKLGVSQAIVSSWEVGRTEPNMGNIQRMAQIFDVTTDYIVLGKETVPGTESITMRQIIEKMPELDVRELKMLSELALFYCEEKKK